MLGTLSCMCLAGVTLSIVLRSSDAAEQSCRAEHSECQLEGVGHYRQGGVEQEGVSIAARVPQPDQFCCHSAGRTLSHQIQPLQFP